MYATSSSTMAPGMDLIVVAAASFQVAAVVVAAERTAFASNLLECTRRN